MKANLDIHLMNGEIIRLTYGEFTLVKEHGVVKISIDKNKRRIMIPNDKICYTEEYEVEV